MGHDHAHHAHGRAPQAGRPQSGFAVGMGLNLGFVVAEVGWGLAAHSLALLADAGHNLGDVLGLGLAWGAAVLASRPGGGRFTYGLRRAGVLAALANSLILVGVTGGIVAEAVRRLLDPLPVSGLTVMAVAAAGIVVNGVCAWLFAAGREHDLNRRGAFLHMAADALVSAGVVVAGGLVLATGWTWLDPAASLAVSAMILVGGWGLLRDAVLMALDAVPAGIDRQEVEALLRALPGVVEVHDLHVWSLGTTTTALTAHVVRPGGRDDAWLRAAADALRERHGIGHTTLQLEQGDAAHPCGLRPG